MTVALSDAAATGRAMQAGRRLRYIRFQSPDVSKASDACSTVASSNLRPMSINLTGSPSIMPQGSVMAGWPVAQVWQRDRKSVV